MTSGSQSRRVEEGHKVRIIFTQGAVKVIHSSTLRSGAIAFYDVGTDLPDTWHVPKVAHVLVRRSKGLHEPAPMSITGRGARAAFRVRHPKSPALIHGLPYCSSRITASHNHKLKVPSTTYRHASSCASEGFVRVSRFTSEHSSPMRPLGVELPR